MILSVLYLLFYATSGILISRYLFSTESFPRRIWLGLTIGLFGCIWLPSLFSFFVGFTYVSHICGAILMAVIAALSKVPKKKAPLGTRKDYRAALQLIWLLPLFLIGTYLFLTHILQPRSDGYYVGQTTYGDLAMHLGFITSIAEQGFFPPDYSIFPGHRVNYPFLCEIPSSSLFQFGASLRWAYLLPALYAYGLVILGVYFAFQGWLKREDRARFATYLFFIGSGFGFIYFFDRLNGASTVGALIGENSFDTNLSYLLNDFYVTPTNLPRIGLRWVNPIVDMLIPQRATLFGWTFLFPCLYLLFKFAFDKKKEVLVPLILFAGGLPLIHTHSFLALGIVSATYCVLDLVLHFNRERLLQWGLYGCITVVLAAPQLFGFAFQQTSESGMVQIHLNWANEVDSYFWFYIKNLGWIFLLMPFALLLLSKKDRLKASGFLVLWLISEIFIFQPNDYDNNKLLFVWFFCLCALTAKLLSVLDHRISHRFCRSAKTKVYALSLLGLAASVVGFLLFLTVFIHTGDAVELPAIGVYTELLILGFLIFISLQIYRAHHSKDNDAWSVLLLLLTAALALYLAYRLITQSSSRTLMISLPLALLLGLIGLCIILLFLSLFMYVRHKDVGSRNMYASKVLLSFLLSCSLFLSGPMTILREWRSSYMMFSNAEIAAAEYIRKNTKASDLFLADCNWHLNAVSVLTGRSIVCGSDTFLFYHGINTYQRREDIRAMFELPEENLDLFQEYGVSYVYMGSPEHMNYDIDMDYFLTNAKLVYDQYGIQVFELI